MAHKLITLLGGDSADSLAIRELQLLARDGVDVRLIADILSKAHLVMRRLGLDPNDTTAEEVYYALISAVSTGQFMSLLEDTDYVLVDIDGDIISFNTVDAINNYHYQLPIAERSTAAAKKGLGWEITRRYSAHPTLSEQRVQQVAGRVSWPTAKPNFCHVSFGKPSIIAIGDIATEVMMTLRRDDAELTGGKLNRRLAINLGSKILAETANTQDAVGGAANASVAFAKLGVQPSLMSWIGDDGVGRLTLNYLRSNGIDMSGVSTKKHQRTNHHYVLRRGAERTIIANYQQYDYLWHDPACRPDWVYLSMISDDSWHLHESLTDYLEKDTAIKLAFQPGPSHLKWGKQKLAKILKLTHVLILNFDEAIALSGRESRAIKPLLSELAELGPKLVVITDGPRGAFAYDGEKMYEVPSYPDPSRPLDRSGAGDAFAATLVAELAKGAVFDEALLRAPINSMSVIQEMGEQAGLLTTDEIQELLDHSPDDYQIKTL